MRKKNLKELHVIRYADDIRILCSNMEDATKVMYGAKKWLNERLKLEVSDEKTRVVNLKKKYGEFLGIKIRTKNKGNQKVIVSHMCDKAIERTIKAIREKIKEIQYAGNKSLVQQAVMEYNSLVRGVHNYYQMATDITTDCQFIHNATYRSLYNRLHPKRGTILPNNGDYHKYKDCKRIFSFQGIVLLPVHYCSYRQTLGKKKAVNLYTPEGRKYRHKDLSFSNSFLVKELASNPVGNQSIEYNDNRVSLFSAQYGKCAITGIEFLDTTEVHCHHKIPREFGGKDNYQNLILILPDVHRLIHAAREDTIQQYLSVLKLSSKQLEKVNKLRNDAGRNAIIIK
jgi:5-methylcytosine-specific restriction endonuclease McrA